MSPEPLFISGPSPAQLLNDVSGAISAALKRGMETDEIACLVATVAADYWRAEYGPATLPRLAAIVVLRSKEPLPEDQGEAVQ